jgi:hypothetical protein
MGQAVRAHEYLGEYKGEIITNGEADRRGTIYQHLATNYLFNLNASQEVDSTRSGNKFRFINNSSKEGTINCYAKPMLANTVTRIGMYAKRDIGIGEELFFNYGYPPEAMQNFWEKGEKPPASSKPKLKLGANGKKSKTIGTKIPKAQAAQAAPPIKPRRGRPPGSTKAAALEKAEKARKAAEKAAARAAERAAARAAAAGTTAGPSSSGTATLTSRPRRPSTPTRRSSENLSASGRRRLEREATRARSRHQGINLEDFLTSEDHVRQVFQADDEEADAGFEPDSEEEADDDVGRSRRRGRKRKWAN